MAPVRSSAHHGSTTALVGLAQHAPVCCEGQVVLQHGVRIGEADLIRQQCLLGVAEDAVRGAIIKLALKAVPASRW
jgi:hypothetical protein